MTENVKGQENAAPSMHLQYDFPSSDAILKMQKIKIVQSAYASFFEVNWFTNGYVGLQKTPDNSYGNPNILISSLWDPNTVGGTFSVVDYIDETTVKSRFGGEGDGWKTINPYNWSVNNWYNLVIRAWMLNDRLFIGTFINDESTSKWVHTATLSIPFTGTYLTARNDSFFENWDGTNSAWNGAFKRKAFFKDCWNLNLNGIWEKNTSAFFSANNSAGDIQRDGVYHNNFNAYFDTNENAYFLQHGGNTIPSAAFNGGRILNLPTQSNQGTHPSLTTVTIKSITAIYNGDIIYINWETDDLKSPQLSVKIEILDAHGNVVNAYQDTLPQLRNYSAKIALSSGIYKARVSLIDIFNQPSTALTEILQ